MIRKAWAVVLVSLTVLALVPAGITAAAEMKLLLPQNRTAFQTNERIDVSVVRMDTAALPAGALTVTATGESGRMTFTFPVKGAALSGGTARAVDHLHFNGWLLRPGKYAVEVSCGGASAKADIEVFSHIRRSSFRTIHWGGPSG